MTKDMNFTPGQRVQLSPEGLVFYGTRSASAWEGTVVRYNPRTHRLTLRRDNTRSNISQPASRFVPLSFDDQASPVTVCHSPARPPAWHTELPDSDTLVLLRIDDAEYPLVLGFHDGDDWRSDDAGLIRLPIVGWLHLCEAAVVLDGQLPRP